jgi:hypothetical protein
MVWIKLFKVLLSGWEVLDISVSEDNAKFASVGGDKAVYGFKQLLS